MGYIHNRASSPTAPGAKASMLCEWPPHTSHGATGRTAQTSQASLMILKQQLQQRVKRWGAGGEPCCQLTVYLL